MNGAQPAGIRKPSLGLAVGLGIALVVIDAFLLNQGVIAILVGLWMLLVALPRTFLARRLASVRRERLRNIAVYLVAVLLVLGLNAANNALARRRAEDLVHAVNAFHAERGRYPRSLEDLVPTHIKSVPLAKYTLGQNEFWYSTSAEDTVLFYVALPPFGRRTYSFATKRWGYLD